MYKVSSLGVHYNKKAVEPDGFFSFFSFFLEQKTTMKVENGRKTRLG